MMTILPPDEHADLMAQARAWVRQLSVGKPTAAHARALKAWCGQSANHARAWVKASQEWDAMAHVLREANRQLPPVVPPRHARLQRRAILGAGLAAFGSLSVMAVLRPPFSLWPSLTEMAADYRTVTGEQRQVAIGPHVMLTLNTQTSIKVSSETDMTKILLIAGEAALAVDGRSARKQALVAGPGRVEMDSGCVEAQHLGNGRVRLVCTEGRAMLRHPVRSLLLEANQQLVYDDRRVQDLPTHADSSASSWRQGIVSFDAMRLDDAVNEINRYRPGRVVLLDGRMAQKRVSGRFRIDALDQAIDLIEQLYQVPVRRLGDYVLVG